MCFFVAGGGSAAFTTFKSPENNEARVSNEIVDGKVRLSFNRGLQKNGRESNLESVSNEFS
jgi:hypothetical protein